MAGNRSLRIGLIVDTSVQQHALRGAIEATGHSLKQSFLTEQCEPTELQAAGIWMRGWLM